MLKIAEAKNIPNARFIHADAQNFLLEEKFDAVAFMTSLEFIERPREAIANAARYLNPGGIILFGVLNQTSWLGESKDQDPVYSLSHFYEEQEILDLFGQTREKSVRQCVFFPPPTMMEKTDDEILSADLKAFEDNLKNGAFIAGRVDL